MRAEQARLVEHHAKARLEAKNVARVERARQAHSMGEPPPGPQQLRPPDSNHFLSLPSPPSESAPANGPDAYQGPTIVPRTDSPDDIMLEPLDIFKERWASVAAKKSSYDHQPSHTSSASGTTESAGHRHGSDAHRQEPHCDQSHDRHPRSQPSAHTTSTHPPSLPTPESYPAVSDENTPPRHTQPHAPQDDDTPPMNYRQHPTPEPPSDPPWMLDQQYDNPNESPPAPASPQPGEPPNRRHRDIRIDYENAGGYSGPREYLGPREEAPLNLKPIRHSRSKQPDPTDGRYLCNIQVAREARILTKSNSSPPFRYCIS